MSKQTNESDGDTSFAAIVATMNHRLLARYRIEAQRRQQAVRDTVKPVKRRRCGASEQSRD